MRAMFKIQALFKLGKRGVKSWSELYAKNILIFQDSNVEQYA